MVICACGDAIYPSSPACLYGITDCGGHYFLWLECGALAIGLWAIVTMKLGNFNNTPDVAPNAQLVRRGPCRFVRHPTYTSLLLATMALVLDDFSLARGGVWCGLLVVLLTKLTYEERLLENRFPDYKIYKRVTKRLVPFLF